MESTDSLNVCQEAVDLIKEFESLHDGDLSHIGLQPKKDSVGIWTIGFGHALRGGDGEFLRGEAGKAEAYRHYGYLTIEGAEALLKQDLAEYAEKVANVILVPLNPNQFGACVSLAYNIGIGAFKKSTVLRKINASDFKGAADAFLLWNKAGGKVLKGLVRRRQAEKDLFLKEFT